MKIEFHPEAIAEARAARIWYQERSQITAQAFFDELELGLEKISSDPEMRALYVEGTRRYLFKHFPYSIVYCLKDNAVEIVAVAHSKRKPGYWKDRLHDAA